MIDSQGFMECAACSKQPGSPTLCAACRHNRYIIHHLSHMLKIIRKEKRAFSPVEKMRWVQIEAERQRLERILNQGSRVMYVDEASDVPDSVFENMESRLKENPNLEMQKRLHGKFEPQGDGLPLYSSSHPQLTPWWKRVLTYFKRPKLSKSNLEHYGK